MRLLISLMLRSGQSKESRLRGKCRNYFHIPAKKIEDLRKERNPYERLQGVNGEGVSSSHYCYAFIPDDKSEVWVRELSCLGCTHCSSARFLMPQNNRLQCENSDILGAWKPYPILKKGEKDPRKVGKNGSFDGKRMFVPRSLSSQYVNFTR